MPIYEYRCESCGRELEKLQKISDPPLVECPACGKPALKKLVSASSFRLKGTGWYETDFKNKKKAKPGSEQDAGSGDSGGKDKSGEDKGGKSASPDNAAAGKTGKGQDNKASASGD